MLLSAEAKKDIFRKYGQNEINSGSSEGQIAMFTERINHLTEHLKISKKDFSTQRALIRLVGKRRALLDYLYKTDINRYRAIIGELGIRK
jgi:small subunit ribosomal protein S15